MGRVVEEERGVSCVYFRGCRVLFFFLAGWEGGGEKWWDRWDKTGEEGLDSRRWGGGCLALNMNDSTVYLLFYYVGGL